MNEIPSFGFNLESQSQHSVFEKRDLFCCSHTFPNKYEFQRTPIEPKVPVRNKVVGQVIRVY